MCGILLAVNRQTCTTDFESMWESIRIANSARGPDAQDTIQFAMYSDKEIRLDIRFFASELRLRGDELVTQPHQNQGNVFCWNGEVFEGLEVDPSENDGIKLFQKIEALQIPEAELSSVLQSIEGPYAFSYYHKTTDTIFFGRDPLGRRSLLIHRPTTQNPVLLVASVSAGSNTPYPLEEVGTEELYCVDIRNWHAAESGDASRVIRTIPRRAHASNVVDFVRLLEYYEFGLHANLPVKSAPVEVNKSISEASPLVDSLTEIPPVLTDDVENLLNELSRSVRFMVQHIPFHVEKGNARVAVLFSGGIDSTILAYLADSYIPKDEPIDLLNVAFENPRKIQLRSESSENIKTRRKQPQNHGVSDARVNGQKNGTFESYLVPDRITGLEELAELRALCPHRQWNFVEVDVTFEETSQYRTVVENLMYPCRTVMDLSLALALYFASRGIGYVRTELNGERVPYTSTARVLINGLGSDELLGGYGRHRTAYTSGGWRAVIEELQLEIDRIPKRNLGRDDRIISSHGKEARHPFLSLSVVNFLAKLPVHHKVDPRLPLGLGDKMLLRLASRKVGLELASGRKKRAMQFGSHSARMEAGQSERRGDLLLS
ncbi:uncharacterized protein FOMMEDRAFT_167293 [Fomitiporia mediterranea MF3/22]|uniref:uncharacterized protein n=1 Tax=Fomitiporia mediterranea (strain MF3/22) TaxID=694068 RepID=UPI00044079B6|nr:uncharacterized protein FOMMEDRAFT_167293 [Fomitiporia mediterranea MF3/22]EJD04010.1 hypothetical protein FOMMEDRAFT_167293 [Fomitiporia mediterranea MF3/22]